MIDELVTLGQRERRRGGRDRDGAPGPAERAGPQPRPLGGVDPGRVRGGQGARAGEGDRGDSRTPGRATSSTTTAPRDCSRPPTATQIKVRLYPNPSHLEFVDPVVTGGARAAQTSRSGPRLDHKPGPGGAAAAPRRRGLPGPGSRRRDAQPPVARRLLDRRHRPHHHRQPGGLHHRPRGRTLHPLRQRSGQGLQRPDHPRQRRRRRGLHRGDPPGDGLPRALGPRRGHRPDRVSPLRPQRDRRARLHPADDGRPDQGPPAGLRDLRGAAGQGGGGHPARRSRRRRKERRDELQRNHQGAEAQDGVGRVRGPDLDPGGHRRARPHQEPRGRDRRLRGPPALAERGAAQGSRELHDPPQAAQAADAAARGARRGRRSSTATPRRSPSPRC